MATVSVVIATCGFERQAVKDKADPRSGFSKQPKIALNNDAKVTQLFNKFTVMSQERRWAGTKGVTG